MPKSQLVLEDGTVFIGEGFGSKSEKLGEVVFYTGMTGYQEIITNPSYYGQIVVMTYPLIGNYGMNHDDVETVSPFINGLVVKEACAYPSNFRSQETLDEFLKVHHIPGISGIDTRKLTKIIREKGIMKATITSIDMPVDEVLQKLDETACSENQVKQTSTASPYVVPGRGKRIVLVDFGAKHGILRELTKRDCHVTVVPYYYDAEQMLRLHPDGILLTNGPGNPKYLPQAIEMIQEILGKVPIFGIGLGHQLLALACGADVEKMKLGHHGSSPVKDVHTGKTFLTAQSHQYTVRQSSLEKTDLEVTQIALHDDTVEGIRHKYHSAFSVQYNPESSPGPEDMKAVFDNFIQMIKRQREKREVNIDA